MSDQEETSNLAEESASELDDGASHTETVGGDGEAADWNALFEDEKSGILAAVKRAENLVELKRAVLVGIERLFQRKADKFAIADFLSGLEEVILKEDFEDTQTAVVRLFGKIKNIRIENAEAFTKSALEGKSEEDNRRATNSDGAGLDIRELEKPQKPEKPRPVEEEIS